MTQIIDTLSKADFTSLLTSVAILIIGFFLARKSGQLAQKLLEKGKILDPSQHVFVGNAVRTVIIFLVIMVAAGTLGISIMSFVALFSVVGLAISLSVQNMLTSFTGGLTIMMSKLFKHGDFIEVDDVAGTVENISFLHTRLKSVDGKSIILPNSVVVTSKLVNGSTIGQRRIDITVSADYGNTPAEVRKAALLAISRIPQVFTNPEPECLLESYDDNAITYTVRCWTSSSNYLASKYALNEGLYQAFAECGVVFTYPHMVVHKAGER